VQGRARFGGHNAPLPGANKLSAAYDALRRSYVDRLLGGVDNWPAEILADVKRRDGAGIRHDEVGVEAGNENRRANHSRQCSRVMAHWITRWCDVFMGNDEAEAEHNFSRLPRQQRAAVCDDCFELLDRQKPSYVETDALDEPAQWSAQGILAA